ncbi:hypothetical protein HWV62_33855 [Athelia sp. TMB]|nr:hypothetical protein HWV62_33855 [Athelia sp. TMB]
MSSTNNISTPPSPLSMSMDSSCASSPLDLTIPRVPFDVADEQEAESWTRHPRYFFEDGNIVFLVGETIYNIHRYFFARDSAHFRSIFGACGVQGVNELNPYILSDVSCTDFDEFLAILYPTDFLHPAVKSTEQWMSMLHLSAKWDFESIKLLAIDRLTARAAPIDKIVLGRRYDIDEWLPGAYEAVCLRSDPLTVEEGMKLGVEDTVRISAAREVYGCAKPHHDKVSLSRDLKGIFGLQKPSEIRKADNTGSEEDAARELSEGQYQTEHLSQDARVIFGLVVPLQAGTGSDMDNGKNGTMGISENAGPGLEPHTIPPMPHCLAEGIAQDKSIATQEGDHGNSQWQTPSCAIPNDVARQAPSDITLASSGDSRKKMGGKKKNPRQSLLADGNVHVEANCVEDEAASVLATEIAMLEADRAEDAAIRVLEDQIAVMRNMTSGRRMPIQQRIAHKQKLKALQENYESRRRKRLEGVMALNL